MASSAEDVAPTCNKGAERKTFLIRRPPNMVWIAKKVWNMTQTSMEKTLLPSVILLKLSALTADSPFENATMSFRHKKMDCDGSRFMEAWRLEEQDFRSTWSATLSV